MCCERLRRMTRERFRPPRKPYSKKSDEEKASDKKDVSEVWQ